MAQGLNRVSLIGNLGKDPEIRQTQSGMSVGTLRIGVTERRKNGDDYKDHTEWVSVVCFGKTAENAQKYLQKGRQIFVEGRLQTRSYQDKAGQTRYVTEVVANQLLFLGGSRDQSQGPKDQSYALASDATDNDMASETFLEDDNIPF